MMFMGLKERSFAKRLSLQYCSNLSFMKEKLLQAITEKKYTVGIVGLGYVGLPLMWTFQQKGFPVIGVDIDLAKIMALQKGESYIKHFGEEKIRSMMGSGNVSATADFSSLSSADAVIMCVPTPLNKYREPDMSYVVNTTKAIAPYIRKGQLIVLESTTYPGTTDEIIRPICEEISRLKAGEDFFIAYSPEREDPGNAHYETATIPKVIGGDGEDALEIADALYSAAIVKTVRVSNTKTAEAVKLFENIFRSVNIALVNEMKLVFHEMGIDVHEVINGAKTKPFGFMPFYPGPGLGGHCIPIDPFYLTWKAREFGVHTKFIELAGEINTGMPAFVVRRVMEALNSVKKSLNGSRVLCVGLAYKADVDDMRESPTFHVMDLLKKAGAEVSYYDSYIPKIWKTREHAEWTDVESVVWNQQTIASFDAVVVVTNHKNIDYTQLVAWSSLIIDSRNIVPVQAGKEGQIWKA